MKLQFTHKAYQTAAVDAVADCFAGQPKAEGISYRLDPGQQTISEMDFGTEAFRNAPLALTAEDVLANIQHVQRQQNLPQSTILTNFTVMKAGKLERAAAPAAYTKATLAASPVHLDIEMETGTGKTYCYIKTMFELNRRFGWSKFIIVVPSIAIREGVQKSLEITAEHFLKDYGKRPRFFTYDSKQLHNLESFSSGAGINVMIINVQAFNATGKDNRRIYEELDDFQSRRPIDVLRANRPILILDEPQKMEGKKTTNALVKFDPLLVLRYSATHKTEHNKIHRLDALDAYNQKLVKKISVHGIAQKGLSGTNSYLYLETILISKQAPVARMEIEVMTQSGIKRVLRKISKNDNLQELSNGLEQYSGYVVADIDALHDTVSFTNEKGKDDFSKAFKANNHIYDYVFTDSKIERTFAENLDTSAEVTVYAKLPRGFSIPTPVGDYDPDWAIAFDAGKVKHIYFIAETKGSMSSLELREIEKGKIACAKKFFAKISSNQVRYDMVNNYEKLLTLVKS